MDLIIGGAYQGKCTFAAEKYRLTAADICDLAADAPAPARCYVHLEALTRRGPGGRGPAPAAGGGGGGGPGDRQRRGAHRRRRAGRGGSATGRLLRQLAESAGHVYRVFCGLTEELK